MSAAKSVKYDKSLSADVAIFTIHDDELKLLLIKRSHAPDEGKWALPGGFRKVDVDHSIDDIAERRLREETGTRAPYLEQLYTFGSDKRDPRGWVTTVAYFAFMPYDKVKLLAGEGVEETKWWTVRDGAVNVQLAFDHKDIIKVAVDRVRSKMEYSSIAGHLLGAEFTLPQLQRVYEIVLGCDLDKTYFRRSLERSGIVEDTGKLEESKGRRRAAIYKFKKGAEKVLFFPRAIASTIAS